MSMPIVTKRSQRIKEIKSKKYYDTLKTIMIETNRMDNYSLQKTVVQKCRFRRDVLLGIYRLLNDNFDMFLNSETNTKTVERMMRMAVSRINVTRNQLICLNIYTKPIKTAYEKYINRVKEYNRRKIYNMVLIATRVPTSVARIIGEYYL